MKNPIHIVGAVLMMGMFVAPVYGASEMAGTQAPSKTLADFKMEYAATKPVVAITKFWEYEMLQQAPRPTLTAARMREEGQTPVATGTKPVVNTLRQMAK